MNTSVYAHAASGQLTAGKFGKRLSQYHPTRRLVKPRQVFPGRPNRRPAQTPTPRPAGSCSAAALALLISLLALQAGGLAPEQRTATWKHVHRWADEIITAECAARGAV